jgi:hypothetical protein
MNLSKTYDDAVQGCNARTEDFDRYLGAIHDIEVTNHWSHDDWVELAHSFWASCNSGEVDAIVYSQELTAALECGDLEEIQSKLSTALLEDLYDKAAEHVQWRTPDDEPSYVEILLSATYETFRCYIKADGAVYKVEYRMLEVDDRGCDRGTYHVLTVKPKPEWADILLLTLQGGMEE